MALRVCCAKVNALHNSPVWLSVEPIYECFAPQRECAPVWLSGEPFCVCSLQAGLAGLLGMAGSANVQVSFLFTSSVLAVLRLTALTLRTAALITWASLAPSEYVQERTCGSC